MAGILWRQDSLPQRPGPILAINYYTYSRAIGTNSLVLWRQERPQHGRSGCLRIQPLNLAELGVLDYDALALAHSAHHTDAPDWISDRRLDPCEIDTTRIGVGTIARLPEALEELDELLLLCHSSAIRERGDLALVLVIPRRRVYEIYPQDWFNQADFDYGYQWVTRVARDHNTGFIHGEGIRIQPFVLDDTLRNLQR